MTSKFTSRFRRHGEAEAAKPDSPETKAPDAAASDRRDDKPEMTAEAQKPQAEASAMPPAPAKSQTDLPEAAPPKPATAENSNPASSARPAVGPARFVEVEKKAARPEPLRAKGWAAQVEAWRLPATAAAALVLALGTGYGIGAASQPRETGGKTAQLLESTVNDLRTAHGQIGQLAAELKSIKGAVEGIKGDREKSRSDILAKQAQLSERVERTGQESATRIGRLSEQLDRIEKAQREVVRQAALADRPERTDRPEKVAAAPTPPAKPHLDPAHTGSLGEAKPAEKPDPRKTPLEGYAVRDYDDGFALIETRSGRYIDVAVGYTLPGVGRVEAIERRGRQWVVITPKGYIGER